MNIEKILNETAYAITIALKKEYDSFTGQEWINIKNNLFLIRKNEKQKIEHKLDKKIRSGNFNLFKEFGVNIGTEISYCNFAHPIHIPFEILWGISLKLDTTFCELKKPSKKINKRSRWTPEAKKEFVLDYISLSKNEFHEKYNLNLVYSERKFYQFKKEIKV